MEGELHIKFCSIGKLYEVHHTCCIHLGCKKQLGNGVM